MATGRTVARWTRFVDDITGEIVSTPISRGVPERTGPMIRSTIERSFVFVFFVLSVLAFKVEHVDAAIWLMLIAILFELERLIGATRES